MAIIYGTSFADTLIGSGQDDLIYGYAGPDYIDGMAGADSIDGGAGTDTIHGGNGNDTIIGGTEGLSYDSNYLFGDDGNDSLAGGGYLNGGTGDDTILGEQIGIFLGDEGNDYIKGTGTLDGGSGNDTLEGTGASRFLGGSGNDLIKMTWSYNSSTVDNYVAEGHGSDTLDLSANNISEISARRVGNDLLMYNGGRMLDLVNWYLGVQYQVENIVFADNTVNNSYYDSLSASSDDHPNSMDSAKFDTAISAINTINGSLDYAYDIDWIHIYVPQNGTYIISTNKNFTSSLECRLFNSSGNEEIIGATNELTVGDYYLSTRAYIVYYATTTHVPAENTGTYSLSLTQVTDDYPGSISEASASTPIVMGQTYNAVIDYGTDKDFFRFYSSTSGTYAISGYGKTNSSESFNYDVYSANGVAMNSDTGGSGSIRTYNFSAGTYYYIKATGSPNVTYSIDVNKDNRPNSLSSTVADVPISSGTSYSEAIDYYGDEDYFRFYCMTDGVHTFSESGSLASYGALYDSNGTLLASGYGNGASYPLSLSFTLLAGQQYYIQIKGDSAHYAVSSQLLGAYTLSVTAPAVSFTDGDSTDMTAAKTIYPEFADYRTVTGHTDFTEDWDWASIAFSNSGWFDITTTGSTGAAIYDATAGAYLSGNGYQSNVYVDASHLNYMALVGHTSGESYSVTMTPNASAHDGDAADLTASDAIFPEYASYRTVYGHTDSSGDWDFCPLYIAYSGYFDLSSTGNTGAAVYDSTVGEWIYGNSYQSNVFINVAHTNYLGVVGYTVGESYSATATPNTSVRDGDSTDLTTSKYLYPQYTDHQTVTGHTDSYGDWDYGSIYVTSSGYYDLSSTGSTGACIYDATAGAYLFGSSYQSNLFVETAHTNYLAVVGYSTGESYSVTATPHS